MVILLVRWMGNSKEIMMGHPMGTKMEQYLENQRVMMELRKE